jgi:hypothetical protein
MSTALVVTSISAPTPILRALASGASQSGVDFVLAGDTRSPAGFHLDGCCFLDIEAQRRSGFALARESPVDHYARKNIAYLVAIQRGATVIVETDDDNWPSPAFFGVRERDVVVNGLSTGGWVNVYRYFSEAVIWPRGFPLDRIHTALPPFETLEVARRTCPIQQGLADGNPDVDAVYRLVLPLPQRFRHDRRIALGPRTLCPFNSQNTTWFAETFPLLYLPSDCSFRMTDIWRSFVAGRIAAENGWWILFHEPTVTQERNHHGLMRDFADEVPGYLQNTAIATTLEHLPLRPGTEHIGDNMLRCYESLIRLGAVGAHELKLLSIWLTELSPLMSRTPLCD